MNMKLKGLTAAAITGLMAISSVVPAQAQILAPKGSSADRDRVVQSYCERNRGDRDCRDFRRGRWNDNDYNRFYRRNRSGLDSISSGLLGFGFGALVGGAIANSNNNNYRGGDRVIGRDSYSAHVEACYARYRSYDERTDTFLGYDGRRHRCNL
ncbi:BA14K family protein [Devosia submarina]|uniref:BA14K family protein n=1 Tax=Devosia submarina TaxID=1173082 RepID=UPI001FE2C5D4|nr:BA14K family protein [Devosia submarina]